MEGNISQPNVTDSAPTSSPDEWTCDAVPSASELLQKLSNAGPEIIVPLCIPPIFLLLMVILYLDLMLFFYRDCLQDKRRAYYAWVLSIYPMESFCSIMGLFVPAAANDIGAAQSLYMGVCYTKFFGLILNFYGGKKNMAKDLEGLHVVPPNPFPCCFVFCCCRKQPLDVPRLQRLQVFVNQLPFFYAFVLFTKALMKADGLARTQTGALVITILDFACVASNFVTLYVVVLLGRISRGPLKEYYFRGKYISFQLVVAINTIQRFSLKILEIFGVLGCQFPYPNNNPAFLYHNYILVLELFVVSLLAWFCFRRTNRGLKIVRPQSEHKEIIKVATVAECLENMQEDNISQKSKTISIMTDDQKSESNGSSCYTNNVLVARF